MREHLIAAGIALIISLSILGGLLGWQIGFMTNEPWYRDKFIELELKIEKVEKKFCQTKGDMWR